MDTQQFRAVRDGIGRKSEALAEDIKHVDPNGRPTRPRETYVHDPEPEAARVAEPIPAWATGTAAAAAALGHALGQWLDDPREIVNALDLNKYLNDDGTIDHEAVAATTATYEAIANGDPAPNTEPTRPIAPNLGQGNVGEPVKPTGLRDVMAEKAAQVAENIRNRRY